MRTIILSLFCVCLVGPVRAGEAPKKVTKTSSRSFDVPKQVAAFVSNLVENNPEVRAQYEKLTAKTMEAAGGRFQAGEFKAIEWLVPSFENDFNKEGGTSDGEYVYLVQRQLISGVHHGYSVDDNVVARVTVTRHDESEPDPKKKEGYHLVSSKIDLAFEGFVEVTLTPKSFSP